MLPHHRGAVLSDPLGAEERGDGPRTPRGRLDYRRAPGAMKTIIQKTPRRISTAMGNHRLRSEVLQREHQRSRAAIAPSRCSAWRMASATIVRVGFSAALDVNWLPSLMNRLSMSQV